MADESRNHAAAMRTISGAADDKVQKASRKVDPNAIAAGFADTMTPRFISAVSTGQYQAASLAEPFLAATVGKQEMKVEPKRFVGRTSAGMPLEDLPDIVLDRVMYAVRNGMRPSLALASGVKTLRTYTGTEIADAGRTATQVQMVSDRGVGGYERVVNVPACDRCIVLAGKLYKYSTGFQRHPNCDCGMMPVTSEQWRTENMDNEPKHLFESMSAEQQKAAFGAANAEAIRQGANMSQVVNARRGATMRAGEWKTSYGASRRGWYGGYKATGKATKRPGRRYRRVDDRPTAGQVINNANREHMSRDQLIRALDRYGYIV